MILLFYVLSLHEFSSWSKLVGIRQESMMRGWKQSYLQLPQKRWCFFKVLRSETGKHSGTTVGLFIPGKIHIYGKRQDKSTANSQLCRAHRMGRGGGRTGCRGVHLCACSPSSDLLLQPLLQTQQQWFAADSCRPARGAEGMSHNSKVTVWREGK